MESLSKEAFPIGTLISIGRKAAKLFTRAGQGAASTIKGSFQNKGFAQNFKNQSLVGGGLTAATGGNYTEFAEKRLHDLGKNAGLRGFKMPSISSPKAPKTGSIKGLSNIKQITTNNLTTKFPNTVKSALNSPKL